MFRHILKGTIRGQLQSIQQVCRQSTESTKWDLLVGVQLERLPIITKTLNKLERDYQVSRLQITLQESEVFNPCSAHFQELLMQLEFENSHKSDFEIQNEKDLKMAELIKSGKLEVDLDAVTKQTSQDLKDMWKDERSKFQLGSRITDADKKNDKTSTNRKLEFPLTLIIEQLIGSEKIALLPQGQIQDGENLRQAAERIIKERCGDSVQAQIYGNAPCGFYKYKYPKSGRKDAIGAKVFFYRAILKDGQVDKKLGTFEWLDKDELLAKVDKYDDYKKSLKQFMI